MYDYSSKELTVINKRLEPLLAQAAEHGVETQQLALDATRLLSCTGGRLDEYKDKGFFKRCWSRLSGKTGSMARANQNDLIEMQKVSWRYLTILQERDLMLAHSIIAVKNNLLTLAVKEEETRRSIIELADCVLLRFTALEDRVDCLEVASGLHSWLLTLSTYDYDERFPPYIRLLRIVRDFYRLKPSDWTLQEIKYLQKAIDEVGLDGKSTITIGTFINGILDEMEDVSVDTFRSLICLPADESGSLISSKFVLDEIAVPFYASLARIEEDYENSMRTIKVLAKQLSLSPCEAHKQTLMAFVEEDGIDITAEIPLRDLAVEILACMGMTKQLYHQENDGQFSVTSAVVEGEVLPKYFIEVYTHFVNDKDEEVELTKSMRRKCRTFAEKGYPEAQFILGKFYEERGHFGESVNWYSLAAEQGIAKAQYFLQSYYTTGMYGVTINTKKAVKWCRLAANQGLAEAQLDFGLMYYFGEGVKKNTVKGFDWIRKAAEQGLALAQYCLGEAYKYGKGVDANHRYSQSWYLRAVRNGCDETENWLES